MTAPPFSVTDSGRSCCTEPSIVPLIDGAWRTSAVPVDCASASDAEVASSARPTRKKNLHTIMAMKWRGRRGDLRRAEENGNRQAELKRADDVRLHTCGESAQ